MNIQSKHLRVQMLSLADPASPRHALASMLRARASLRSLVVGLLSFGAPGQPVCPLEIPVISSGGTTETSREDSVAKGFRVTAPRSVRLFLRVGDALGTAGGELGDSSR